MKPYQEVPARPPAEGALGGPAPGIEAGSGSRPENGAESDARSEDAAGDAAGGAAESGGEPDLAAGEEGASPSAGAEEPESEAGPGPGEELDDEELSQQIVALLFASPEPLATRRLVRLLERPSVERVERLLEELGPRLAGAGLPLQLTEVAGGWRLVTMPHVAEVVTRLSKARKTERISPAALETLSIVAYRQPVTKAEIEAIRGVQAGPVLRSLVERGLVRISGRADQPGSPLQYGTTKEFLDRFGLASLDDLPRDAV